MTKAGSAQELARWTDHWTGFLTSTEAGYVRNKRTPDIKAQHPTAWAAIEADYATWWPGIAAAKELIGAKKR